ncbi:NaeI family type II restriction endonuclease [Streptomyces iconiensis]|uniref:NaeI family type II restriction endonuclease n=1 Tax=Streptomyces iconiensis TaxID=1384038 RepID=A0ABT6ZZK1_9ACTN|nr:NaeI family type II restriction endonuclease [Streptomyces iconiensis]MDJ1134510.1 NaeI family type II restriction endonuclease [Streptomyces iconiensis]
MEARFGAALRQSIDEVLDRQRTGRFDVTSRQKTGKTYLGTKAKIIVRPAF